MLDKLLGKQLRPLIKNRFFFFSTQTFVYEAELSFDPLPQPCLQILTQLVIKRFIVCPIAPIPARLVFDTPVNPSIFR